MATQSNDNVPAIVVDDTTKKYVPMQDRIAISVIRQSLISVQAVRIENEKQFEAAGEAFKKIAEDYKTAYAIHKKRKEPYLEGGKAVDGFFKPILDYLKSLRDALGEERAKWEDKLLREERERQRKAAEEAEIKRKEAEDAAMKKEQEAIELKNKDRKAAAEAYQQSLELQRKARQEAEAQEPEYVPEKVIPKTSGVSAVKKWKGEILDQTGFIKWCIANKKPEYLKVDATAWNRYAQNKKEAETLYFYANPVARVFVKYSSRSAGK